MTNGQFNSNIVFLILQQKKFFDFISLIRYNENL